MGTYRKSGDPGVHGLPSPGDSDFGVIRQAEAFKSSGGRQSYSQGVSDHATCYCDGHEVHAQ